MPNNKEIPPGFRDANEVLKEISREEDIRLGSLCLMQGESGIPHGDRFSHNGGQGNRHGIGQLRAEKDYNG